MGQYRLYRAIEASLIDQITSALASDGWSVRTEKEFSEAWKGNLPCILIGVQENSPIKKEIGSKTYLKYITINFRIFATSDGQRLDLADWLFNEIEDDFDYYTYTITNGEISEKTLAGKIRITRILRDEKELQNTENLSVEDKYRHIIQAECLVTLN